MKRPERVTLTGQYIDLVPLDPSAHGDALYEATAGRQHEALWTYMPDGPFFNRTVFDKYLQDRAGAEDAIFLAVIDRARARAVGYASLMRIEPAHRVVEVGHILYTAALQRTQGGTEAMYLMARYVFEDLEYRRYEWKCNAENLDSRRAALRLGFTFEGMFRQHMIVKGRNRDTAWFSMLDREWPARKIAFERWLARDNFDESGRQKSRLESLR